MEKYVFLSMLRSSLLQMNVPTNNIVKHVEVFEKYISGKTPEDTKKIIKSIGGLDGALEAVYKVESPKNPNIIKPSEIKKASDDKNNSPDKAIEEPSFDETNVIEEDFTPDLDELERQATTEISIENKLSSTKEMPALEELPIEENIELISKSKQNTKVQEEMEKTTVNDISVLPGDNFEFATELPPLEDEIMAYKHPSRMVESFKFLRNKMSDEAYKYTLPLTTLVKILGYAVLCLLFPVIAIVMAVCYVLYYVCMIGGGIVSLVSIIYGIIKIRSYVAAGLYEIGIGIIVIGITLALCILIYLFNKKLIPLLFAKSKDLFKLWTKANKAFFRNHVKEVRR